MSPNEGDMGHPASARQVRLRQGFGGTSRIGFVSHSFEIGPVRVGEGRLFLIAGPCVIESEAHVRKMAEAIQRITSDLGVSFIFKASYDKANRTSVKSFRGPGLVEGTEILGRLAKDTGLPVLTDVHEPGHCEVAAEHVDVLQIPAFLCRHPPPLGALRFIWGPGDTRTYPVKLSGAHA